MPCLHFSYLCSPTPKTGLIQIINFFLQTFTSFHQILRPFILVHRGNHHLRQNEILHIPNIQMGGPAPVRIIVFTHCSFCFSYNRLDIRLFLPRIASFILCPLSRTMIRIILRHIVRYFRISLRNLILPSGYPPGISASRTPPIAV